MLQPQQLLLQEFEWLEFFAGEANLTKAMASALYVCGRFDILYNEQPRHRKSNFMDLTHASGFASLVIMLIGTVSKPFQSKESILTKGMFVDHCFHLIYGLFV